MRRFSYLTLTVVCSLLLLVAACGDDDDDSEQDTPTEEETQEEDSTPAGDGDDGDGADGDDNADDEATVEEEDDGGDEDDGGSDEDIERQLPGDIEELLGSLDTVRVEYDLSVTIEGEEDLDGTATLTADGGSFRLDFASEDATGSVIVTEEASYFCAEGFESDDEDAEGACFEFPGGQDLDESGVPFFDLFADVLAGGDEAGVSIEDAEDQEIVGEEADCFTLLQEEIDGEALVCLSADNAVPLLIEGAAEGEEFRLEATDISDDVGDEDFEPPYPITEIDFGDFGFDDDGGSE